MKVLWQQIASPIITEIFCKSNFDGVVFDLEHGCFNPETLYSCIQVCTLSKKTSLIRVTDVDKTTIRMALDAGCKGVILSTAECGDRADEFCSYCRYPPKGTRGQGLVRENFWGEKDIIESQNNPILIAQIETKEGAGSVKVLATLPFDYFLIGPYDLSASLGQVGVFDSAEYIYTLKKIAKAIPLSKMGYHVVKDIEDQIKNPQISNCGFLALSLDTLMLINGVKQAERVSYDLY